MDYTASIMETPPPSRRRNIGILAHIDAGKTSLTERLLYMAGRIREAGDIESGTTATDYLAVERERGITVKAAAARLEWRGTRVSLIDTPGHVDFGAEVERSLRALDGAVLLVCGVAGVQSRTETVYRALERRAASRLFFVNKMDRRGASFSRVLGELEELTGRRALAVCLPWGEGEAFRGVVDLVGLRALDFKAEGGSVGEAGEAAVSASPSAEPWLAAPWTDIPPDGLPAARAAREELVAALAEGDEGLFADYASGRECSPESLRSALRAATVAGRAFPVLCGSAFEEGSASFLLEAVLDYLPSPEEAGCPAGEGGETRLPSPVEAFSALVFKTQADPHFGRLSWARVWSGRLAPGDRVLDAGSGARLRVQKLFAIQAASLEEVEGAAAGDIVAVAFGSAGKDAPGRGSVRRKAAGQGAASAQGGSAARGEGGSAARLPGSTGSSLSDPDRPILYEPISFEEPVVTLALEPRSRADEGALKAALEALLEEDPSLRLREDRETGRVTLAGMGELHLEVALERLREERGVAVRAGRPEVAYKECLAGPGEARADFDKDYNGEVLKASVALALEPAARGAGLAFAPAPGLKAQAPLLAAARRGLEAALSAGPAAGYPVVDLSARILELSAPQGRQSELAAEIAASLAARDCLRAAGTLVLEPWMRLEIVLPEELLGEAAAVVSGRSGRIESVGDGPGGKLVEASAPLRLLFGLAGELRSATAGRAGLQSRFQRYAPVPPDFGGKRP